MPFCEPVAHECLLCKTSFPHSPFPVPRFHEDKFYENEFHEDEFGKFHYTPCVPLCEGGN